MKKTVIAIFAGLVVIPGAVWWFRPRPLVGADYEIHFVRMGERLDDVTDQVDIEALENALQGQTCGRLQWKSVPNGLTENAVEIIGMDSQERWHIWFSEEACVVYVAGERGSAIQNSDELWAEVLALMPETK